MNNDQPSKRIFSEIFKADLKIALTIIGRTVAVLIIFSIAVASGYGIPYFFRTGLSHLMYGGAALGAGIILATFKSLVETIPIVWTYISSGTTEKLSVFFVRTFIAVLGFYFAFFSIQPNGESGSLPVVLSFSRDPLPALVRYDDSLITFYITFSEDSSAFPDNNPQKGMLDNVLEGIHNSMDTNNITAEVTVIGFASTSGSNSNNLKLANDRAKNVADYLREKANLDPNDDPNWPEVTEHRWSTYCEMERHLIFKDRARDHVYSEEAGLLNRRVEIHLMRVTERKQKKLIKD